MGSIRLTVLAMCFCAVACKSSPNSEPVARVNGETISKKDFQEQVDRNMSRYKGQAHLLPPGIETRIQESILRRMIDDVVIAQKAKAMSIAVTDEEVDAKFKEHRERFHTDQAFQDYLKRSSNTEQGMKDDIRRSLLRDRVIDKLAAPAEVTDADVQKYYTDNMDRFRDKEQIKASRILIPVAPDASKGDKKVAEKEAKKVRTLAAKKGADFAAVAREHSKGPEAAHGGDLGWLPRGRMPADFDAAAFAVKPNNISEPVLTKSGYEIIRVEEYKGEHVRPLDEVKDNIKNALLARMRNEKRRDTLVSLKNDAKIEQLMAFNPPPPPAPAGAPGTPPAGAPAGAAAPGAAPAAPPAAPAPAPAPAPAADHK